MSRMVVPPGDAPQELEELEELEPEDPILGLITDFVYGELPPDAAREVERRLETDQAFLEEAFPILLVANCPPRPCHWRPAAGRKPSPGELVEIHYDIWTTIAPTDRRVYNRVHDSGTSIERAAWLLRIDADEAKECLLRANWRMAYGLWRCGYILPLRDLDTTLATVKNLRARLVESKGVPDFLRIAEEEALHDNSVIAKPLKPSVRFDMQQITDLVVGTLPPQREREILSRLRSDMEFYGWAQYTLLAWTVPPRIETSPFFPKL